MPLSAGALSLATVLLLVAAIWDLRKRRIPNALCATIAAAGAGGQLLTQGWQAAATGLGIGAALVAALFWPWLRGLVGGGDVKLAGAAAVWVPPRMLPSYLAVTAVAGAAVAALSYARSSQTVRREIRSNLAAAVVTQSSLPDVPIRGGQGRVSVPYGVAVAIGALTVLWTGGMW